MKRSQRRNLPMRLVLLAGLLLLLAWLVLGRGWWLPALGEFLVVGDRLERADAVVVLGGGKKERAQYGATLVAQGWADWLIVPDAVLDLPGIRDSYADLMRREAMWSGVAPERILVEPGTVETTLQEAQAVGGIARERGFHRVIVVTEPFHTRRARLIFNDALHGEGLAIAVLSPPNTTYHAERWWVDPGDAAATSLEYLKLAAWFAGLR